MLYYITGISTSGKSAVALELKKRGYEAYDTEHNGISAWFSKKTGERVAEFNEMPERTKKWLSQHEWLISIEWIKKIASQAKSRPIFICGGSANEAVVRAVSDKVVFLKTNENTIRSRLKKARDHNYGTKPHEMHLIIKGSKQKETEYKNAGAVVIDATRPLNKVVDSILKEIGD